MFLSSGDIKIKLLRTQPWLFFIFITRRNKPSVTCVWRQVRGNYGELYREKNRRTSVCFQEFVKSNLEYCNLFHRLLSLPVFCWSQDQGGEGCRVGQKNRSSEEEEWSSGQEVPGTEHKLLHTHTHTPNVSLFQPIHLRILLQDAEDLCHQYRHWHVLEKVSGLTAGFIQKQMLWL